MMNTGRFSQSMTLHSEDGDHLSESEARADPAQEPEEEKADGEQEELLAVWWEDRKYSGLLDE